MLISTWGEEGYPTYYCTEGGDEGSECAEGMEPCFSTSGTVYLYCTLEDCLMLVDPCGYVIDPVVSVIQCGDEEDDPC